MENGVFDEKFETEVQSPLVQSVEALRCGDFEKSLELFSGILKSDYSNEIAESGVRFCKHWISRSQRILLLKGDFEKGKSLIDEWSNYLSFAKHNKGIHPKIKAGGSYFVFSSALRYLNKYITENSINDPAGLYMLAISYKKIGDFETAIKSFEKCLQADNTNSNAMAQLADCYALTDEEKKSKLLFREAFFIDPYSIVVNDIDSGIISAIVSKIKEFGEPASLINGFIPVYGRVFNLLNIYRDLISIEIGKLEKEIFSLERLFLNQPPDKRGVAVPRLLNCYFRLYDYLIYRNNDKYKVMEIEQSIKNVSEKIYDLFIKNRG